MEQEERQRVIARIQSQRTAIVENLLGQVLSNPFWELRFGERGKSASRQDANYHLDNLITAIRMDMPSSPEHYYRWLRSVLVHRGICTRDIRRTIDCLAVSIEQELPEEWPEIQPYLEAGYCGLEYELPACKALSNQENAIAREAAGKLLAEQSENGSTERENACFEEFLWHLSYLVDEVGLPLPGAFEEHMRWLGTNRSTMKLSVDLIREELVLLSEGIKLQLEPDSAAPFSRILEEVISLT